MLIGAGNVVKGGVTLSKPVPSPASVVTSSGSVNEGSSITFTSTSVGVPNGTTLYWSMYGYGSATSDADFDSVTGSFTVVNGVGTFPVDIIADNLTEGAQSFSVAVRTESISGAIIGISDTVIINDTSVNRPHWTDGDATATGEIVTYRYYKFHITKTRNMPPTLNATQISELIILNGSNRLPGGTASNPDGHTGENEGPDKALDGYYDNKICDQYFTTNGNSSTIIVDYTSAQSSNGFTFAVANDSPSRDPVRWTFEGSNDGSTWTVLHEQLNDADVEYQRNRLAGTVFNYQVHGSAVFNQPENDYMSVPAGSYLNLGTTWTIEFWIYMNYGSNDNTHIQGGIWGLLNQDGWGATNSINIGLASGYLQVAGINSSAQYRAFIEPTPQQWIHVAIVNNAGTQSVFYNGVQQVQVNSDSGNGNYSNSTSPLYIGSLNAGNRFDGKLTNLRITNTAVYAANFYPPTTLPTKISGTKLLWNPTDQALTTDTSDSAATITNNGVTYSSSYPLSDVLDVSAVFNGSTNRYYKVPGGSHLQLGTTWTIEWWQKSTAATAGNGNLYTIMSQAPDGGRIDIYYQDGSLKVQNGQTLCAEPAAGVWVHVAIVNNAGVGTVYYDGVAQGASGNFGNYGQTQDLYIGKRGNNTFQYFNGKLTNIRITDTAVYTANFVPDILPTRITGHTKLLLTPIVDTVYGVDKGDNNLAIQSSGIRFNSDYPQIVVGGTITDTVTGDSGLYGIDYTTKTGVTVGSIAVKDAATLGSVSIVGTTIFYLAPCFQGSYNEKTGYDHQGTEIDNFSLYFTGNFGKTIVPVSVTINAV